MDSLILSIETSTKVCSVALHLNGALIAYNLSTLPRSHIEHLMDMIKSLFSYTSYGKSDLKAIAISDGPGSYTGLRIGASVAKGMCYGLEIPLISVNSLANMLYFVKEYGLYNNLFMCPMMDANKMRVYSLITDSNMDILKPTHVMTINENVFDSYIVEKKILLFGDGADKHKSVFLNNDNVICIDNVYPNAMGLGKLAYDKYLSNQLEDILLFEPSYIK